jgi:HlyD family secretion protein
MKRLRRTWLARAIVLILPGGGYYAWQSLKPTRLPAGIAAGNGRMEATEVDIATDLGILRAFSEACRTDMEL